MPANPTARTYFGWQPEKVNFLFGLTGRRAGLLGAACVAAMLPFATSNPAIGVVWWPVAGVVAAVALTRIHGISIDEWITAAASYQLGRIGSRHKFLGGPASPGHVPVMSLRDRSWHPGKARNADLPGVLAPQRILLGEISGEPLAVVHHRLDRTYTAVAKVRFPGIGLVDTSRQQARVDGWASVLAGLCTQDSPIVRVQAMQRLLPESGAALRRWHADHLATDAPDAAVAVTDQLLSGATLATAQRDAYLAFTLDARRAGSAIKAAGGGDRGAMTVLARQARVLASSMSGADLSVESWLSPRDLSEVIRTVYDPHAGRHLSDRRATHHSEGLQSGVHPGVAGPAAAQAQPGAYVHDGAKSVTYWVYDWPRARVYATALAPLLGEGHHRRAVSLHIEPLGPREAERQVMRERTSRDVAVRMRQRTGQIVPEHERAALQRAEAQDSERAAGHGLARFC
ncbi:MAG: SCO6880 family protein, partial [Stackebrandtia sp.]